LHYEGQSLSGAVLDVFGAPTGGSTLEDGFNYIEMRDGVLLSAMVRFPDPLLYGPGPYPTVIEYSGYGPSNPASEEPGVRIARAFGYATVAVNLRGTGCSGGVFDVFNPAQMADGYDVVETVARQPWALHGHVGMVGLSYSGITQLYTAVTRPPSLAAVLPQSVIRDSWEQAWPGGIFNAGFTREWLAERDRQASAGGTSWVQRRIDGGDAVCGEHMVLRAQNPDFESFVRALERRPPDADERSLPLLLPDVEVPTFLTGAFQDEQTGPQFTSMIDALEGAPVLRVSLWNGRHPDGYGPQNLNRWFEFLELYVARRVPVMNPLVRAFLPGIVAGTFGLADVEIEADRFASLGADHAAALAAYESEPPVRVVFESGTGADEPGEPVGTFELDLEAWPPPAAQARTWYLDAGGVLADAPGARGRDAFGFDPEAGGTDLFPAGGYPLFDPTWSGAVWSQFAEGEVLSYLTPPAGTDVVFAGPGRADLVVAADTTDAAVMVTVSEVRPDGTEVLVQNGVQRLGYRVDQRRSDGLEVAHDFSERGYRPLRPGQLQQESVEIPSFNHVLRAGSRLRVTIATPGRNFAAWAFDNPAPGGVGPTVEVQRGTGRSSSVTLSVLPGIDVPPGPAPCPGLRGQVCRPYEARTNLVATP
jgi:predicted acyl esterase